MRRLLLSLLTIVLAASGLVLSTAAPSLASYKVVCQRIYSHVTFSVRPDTYSGIHVTYGATRTISVPSTLGVRIVD